MEKNIPTPSATARLTLDPIDRNARDPRLSTPAAPDGPTADPAPKVVVLEAPSIGGGRPSSSYPLWSASHVYVTVPNVVETTVAGLQGPPGPRCQGFTPAQAIPGGPRRPNYARRPDRH